MLPPETCLALSEPNGRYAPKIVSTGKILERATGIEPVLFAWEAKVLPLNYARIGRHPALW